MKTKKENTGREGGLRVRKGRIGIGKNKSI